jgi:hypothetical protein
LELNFIYQKIQLKDIKCKILINFLPLDYNYEIVNSNDKSDIIIWDMNNNEHLSNHEINILICVENVDH